MQNSFKTTLIQGYLGTCGRNILPIRHKRSHDTSSGEASTKKNQTLSQNDLISSSYSTILSRTVHMRARQTLPNGCLNMGENIIKKGMGSYQRYGMKLIKPTREGLLLADGAPTVGRGKTFLRKLL